MALTASPFAHQGPIKSAIRTVEELFSSQVIRIGYSLGEDATESPSIFFRILVRDEAAPVAYLKELSQCCEIPSGIKNDVSPGTS